MKIKELKRKLGLLLGYVKEKLLLFRIIFIRIILFPIVKTSGNRWMILERGKDAQDNAWHFFKYMVREHPEFQVKYAIDKRSRDFATNLKGYEQYVVEYGSLRYYFDLFSSSWVISTHLYTMTPSISATQILSGTPFGFKGKVAFLQHGIIHNDHNVFHYPTLKVDLFITGAKREYELTTRLFNQPEGILQCTGLARFDNLDLNHKCKKQILIMPTWRFSYVNLKDEDFERTDFFTEYAKILKSEELIAKLKETGYEIVFYNHFEFQKFNHLFELLGSDTVHIGHFGEKRVQELLNESALLVTDYSSVYYDFIYMQKPVVFFKLNKAQFEGQQYGIDYDNPNDFGDVGYTSDEIIDVLIDALDNDCKMKDCFVDNMNRAFERRDHQNCERIFKCISAAK